MRRTNHRKGERGTQLVELALVLPLMLFLAFFVTEGAGFLRMHQVMNNAAREGARLSSFQDNQCADSLCTDPSIPKNVAIKFAVLNYLCANGVQYSSSLPGAPPCGTGQPAVTVTVDQNVTPAIVDSSGTIVRTTRVTVARTYNLPLMSAIPWFGIPSSITLTTSARFRTFY